jgi:hypothetical protein
MTLNGKPVKFLFRPPTRAEYEHVLAQLFKRGYVFDPNSRCSSVEDVWSRWKYLDTDYPFLAVYEGTNVTDAFSTLDKVYLKQVCPIPFVDSLPTFAI